MILSRLTSSIPRLLKATISSSLLLVGLLIPPSLLGQVYEAEDAVLSGPAIFSGQGASTPYVDFQSASGDYIEWTIPSVNTGDVTLSFVYQLGASADRPLELRVNGVVANPSMSFPSTGSWSTWDTISIGATLQSGNNTVRLTAIGSSGGNFDFLIAETICPPVLFSGTIFSYAGTQDNGTSTVLDNQATLLIEDNAWKAIAQSYTITANTVIEFDFKSTVEGEEHAFGFNQTLDIVNDQRFKLYGTQNTSANGVIQDYNNYAGAGNYQHYSVPVGQYYTGQMEYLFFVCDNDAAPTIGDSYFSNVLIYEDLNQNGQPDDCGIPILVLGPPSIQHFFNFSDSLTIAPSGWEKDYGLPYGPKPNGLTYGWVNPVTKAPADLSDLGRNREPTPDADIWRETLLHLNLGSGFPDGAWEIALPNGEYRITVQVGDPNKEGIVPAHHILRAEGNILVDLIANSGEFGTRQGTKNVTITDGALTIDGVTGTNTKIQSLSIESTDGLVSPIVLQSIPADGSELVSPTTSISANFLDLPNTSASGATSIDNTSITSGTVQLYEITTTGDVFVQGSVNGTGGGDAINFTPASTLKPNTSYRFVINGVLDLTGTTVLPFSAVFTTDTTTVTNGGDLDQVAFISGGVVASGEKYTTLTMGPDGKLYGITISGVIHRWDIAIDGSLTSKETLTDWKTAYGGSRTAVGLTFDPSATSSNLIAYVSHCSLGLSNAPEWDGKISRLSGPNLATEELLVTNLPRSIRDHLTNSLEFRPGEPNVIYFLQGSNSAGGAADGGWGNRPERLLTAAFLRLDLSLLPATLPLDAKTSMDQSVINAAGTGLTTSDGLYNPYGTNAPLTLYATGIRNAYDFVWHSNGQAYIATNGTAGGSLSPASIIGTRRPDGTFYNGPVVPAIGPNQTQRDWLFRVDPANPLGYYGHPNPLRGEYVLNRGFADEADYASTQGPDTNYRGAAFDFEFNKSPNGVIEYKSASNGGHLQGAILVCRYSGGSDLIALVPDGPNGDISTHKIGVPGFAGFQDPLDLTEDLATGNIYVSDYGSAEIILLKPGVGSPGELAVTPDKTVENIAVNSSKTFSVTVANVGGSALGNVQLALSGDDASQFSTATSVITSLAGGSNMALNVVFSPTSAGPKFATLTISAPGATTQTVDLRGIGTSGEPSLQWILDAHLGEGVITVGDDNPANNIIHSSAYAAPILGDEISAQSFIRVDETDPVSIEVLSVFGPTASNPVTAFGWYETGNPNNNQELFTIANAPSSNGQTVNAIANGSLSFNPNSAVFGFFNRWPFFNNRILYSEDAFNTFTGNLPHHIRVYPVPGEANAYVIATEEHIAGFDFQDIVVIVRNIAPFVSTGAQITVENRMLGLDDAQVGFPADDLLVFHKIETVTTHEYHDVNVLRVSNPGISTLLISNLNISDISRFVVESITSQTGVALSTNGAVQVPAGEYVDIAIRFIESAGSKGLRYETLSIVHNASSDPFVINLNGAYMLKPEGGNELNAQQVIDVFGFTTDMSSRIGVGGTILANPTTSPGSAYPDSMDIISGFHGDLVLSQMWEVADVNEEVTAIHMGAFHGCCGQQDRTFITNNNPIDYVHEGTGGQSLLPKLDGNSSLVAWSNSTVPTIPQPGAITINGYNTNPTNGQLGIRVYKVKDADGNIIPYAYIALQDNVAAGCGAGSANCDWNDNLSYMTNIKPVNDPFAMGIPDQITQASAVYQLDMGTYFNLGYPGNELFYSATLSNGALLPAWASLDSLTGQITGTPPSDADSALDIAVLVHDLNNITMEDTFHLSIQGTVKLLAASTNLLDFGSQVELVASSPLSITFYNASSNNITLPSVSITGANAAEFSDDFVGTEVLNPGDSLTIDVTFTPASGGQKQATLSLNPSTPGISPATITLLGEGVTATGTLFASAPVVTFRARTIGTAAPTAQVTLTNDGDFPVTVSSVAVIGANASDFTHSLSTPLTLPAGGTQVVDLNFLPSSFGKKVGGVSFVHNGLNASPTTVSLFGGGVNDVASATLTYRINTAGGMLLSEDTPNSDWSIDNNGAGASPYRNNGSSTYGGFPDSIHYSVPVYAPFDLFKSERSDPGANPEMEWDFPITTAGEYEVHLFFMNNYGGTSLPGQRVFDVSLEGTVVLDDYDVITDVGHKTGVMKSFLVEVTDGNLDLDFLRGIENPFVSGIEIYGPIAAPLPPGPQLVVNSASVVFPATGIGTSSPAETIALFNPGTDPLVISGMTISGSADFAHQASLPLTIPAGSSYNLDLIFSPAALGMTSSSLSITHDGVTTSPLAIALSGEGTQVGGQLDLTATTVVFPLTEVNTNASTETVTFTNTGNANLTLSSISLIGANATDFSLNLVGPIILTPGQSTIANIGFSPTTTGVKTADISISHDGLNPTLASISLSGESVDSLPAGSNLMVLHRINTGGTFVAATDGPNPDWSSDDNGGGASTFRNQGSNTGGTSPVGFDASVPTYVPATIFSSERWDPGSAPEMEWDFPTASVGLHEVRLYVMNNYGGTSQPGTRVFDIEAEGTILAEDIDPAGMFGHQTGGMVSFQVMVTDGNLDLNFIHQIENTLVNGIEILGPSTGGGTGSILAASPGALNFGSALVGNTLNQILTLSNSGSASITISAVNITGTSATEFTTSGTFPLVLPAGGNTTIAVSFTPGSVATHTASLEITHDGLNTSPLPVTLEGTGSNSTGGGTVGFLVDDVIAGISSPTSLNFGPDGRLYVSQQNGTITVYEITRNSAGDYTVTSSETINLVKEGTLNHDDDGAENTTTTRQVTGLMVMGTAAQPVLYVTSSDWRISLGTDSNLDTNSGVLSRLTWTGIDRNDPNGTWVKVDLVRGLPRSEENHATNGLDYDPATNKLYIAQGGHTNKGAPSNNLSGTPEYALSGAILSVDLTAIDAMPVYTDARSGGQFVYDIPTLDDPTRTNITSGHPDFPYASGHPYYNEAIDLGDPFGGNNGLNQARWIAGGPVQVHSGGYRNPFDVVVTNGGRVYTFDNGPNGGWGGKPLVYDSNGNLKTTSTPDIAAGDYVTNEFNENDGDGYGDQLHFITGYGYFGGHANPTRAFQDEAGYYVYEKVNGNWAETSSYDFATDFPLPPVDPSLLRPEEAVHVDNNNDGSLTTINASTNGITEYTASNFGGALQGNLLAASFNDNIYRFELNGAGDQVMTEEALLTGFGDNPLDVTALGDNDPFPGTIWVALHGSGKIVCFEPNDFAPFNCTGADDPNLDEDNDGYSNADEIDNGTNPCSQGSKPQDYDGDFISNLNDPDDDNDGWLDTYDPFAVDSLNGLGNKLPVEYGFSINNGDNIEGSLFGIGFTGVMTNGELATQTAGVDYGTLYSEDSLKVGGANSKFAIAGISSGTAWGAANNQENAFQYGIDVDAASAPFTIHSEVESPFFLVGGQSVIPTNDQSMGLFFGNGDQDNYISIVLHADGGAGGIRVTREVDGIVTHTDYVHPVVNGVLANTDVNFYLSVDPSTLTVQPKYSTDEGQTISSLGTPLAIPASWLSASDAQGLAVGVISSSVNSGTPFTTTWDFLTVSSVEPYVTTALPDQTVFVGTPAETIDLDEYFGDDMGDANLTYTISDNTGAFVSTTISGSSLTVSYPANNPDEADLIVRATDSEGYFAEDTFHVSVMSELSVLYRINTGGVVVASTDSPNPDWDSDDNGAGASTYRNGGSNTGGTSPVGFDSSVPTYAPSTIFTSERWDPGSAPEMEWDFPATYPGIYEVRVYIMNNYGGTSQPGDRVFDIEAEGVVMADDIDPAGMFGHQVGGMVSFQVNVTDGNLDVDFIHVTENTLVNAIEILGPNSEPSVAQIAVNPNSIDFGINGVGVSSTETVTISNTGSLSLTVSDIQLQGADASVFTHDATIPMVIPAGGSQDVEVTFLPTVSAVSSAQLVVSHFGANTSPVIISITGQGLIKENLAYLKPATQSTTNHGGVASRAVDGNTNGNYNNASVTHTTNSINPWWRVDLGQSFDLDSIRVFNRTNCCTDRLAAAKVFAGTIDSNDPADYTELGTLADLESQLLDNLTVEAQYIMVYHTSTTAKILSIAELQAYGDTAVAPTAIFAATPDPIHFFSTSVGTSATPETVTVTNSGTATLTVSTIQLQGGGALEFGHNAILPMVIAPGASGTFQVSFTPTTAGSMSAQLVFAHDGVNGSPSSIPVSGEAITAGGGGGGTAGMALFRINTGGTQLAAADGSSPDWAVDMPSNPSPYLISGGENTYGSGAAITLDPTVSAGALMTMFQTERYDQSSASPMAYAFPITPGTQVEVRLYLAELYFGTAGSRVFDVLIEGSTPAEFNQIDMAGTYGKNVGAMLSHTVTVTDGTLDIEFAAIANNPAVKGIEIVDLGSAGSALSASASSVSFGDNFIGDLATETIQLANTGGDTLTISSMTLTGSEAGMFAFDLSAPMTLLPLATTDLQLSFLPSVTGIANATLQMVHDGTNGSPFEITLTGNGLQTGGIAMALPTVLSFPSTYVDSVALPRMLTLANTGNANMTITGLTISGAHASDFSHDFTVAQTLVPNSSIPVEVVFTPSGPGSRTATFTVIHDGVNSSAVTISLDGEGLIPVTASSVTYRVNVGGATIAAADSPSPDWSNDGNGATASPYRNNVGNVGGTGFNSIDPSVPVTTPSSLFTSERWDPGSAPELEWDFPVSNGTYEVRLYFMNSYGGTSNAGQRVFDVSLEGIVVLDDLDISSEFGHKVGGMKSMLVSVTDGSLDIDFTHVVDNPLLNGIEIVAVPNSSVAAFTGDETTGTVNADLFPGYELHQNYPNPFVDETVLEFEVPQSGHVRLGIYNQIGQLVWESNSEYPAGRHAFSWQGTDQNGSALSSGMYHCVMETEHGIVGAIKLLKQ